MDLSGKKLAVYGLGVTGRATLNFLKKQKLQHLTICSRGAPESWNLDKNSFPYDIVMYSDEDPSFEGFSQDLDLLLLSPGIPRTHPLLRPVLKRVPIWNEIELASRIFKGPILAITGTNGKTTTVSLIGDVLKRLGVKAFVGGNIGIPFIEALKESYQCAILEISSFQCESLETFNPSVSGILNLFPNHGERYSQLEDYRASKWKMVKNLKDHQFVFIGKGVGLPPFDFEGKIEQVSDGFEEDFATLFDLKKMKIVGKHNRLNAYFAYLMLEKLMMILKISRESYVKAFQDSLNEYKGVEHRIEFIGKFQNLLVYNDAKSTNWEATITALKAVSEKQEKVYLVIGGQLRGNNDLPPEEFLNFISHSNLEVLTIGEAGEYFKQKEIKNFISCKNIDSAINSLKGKAGVLLFSPGFPSFDQFKNYAERGIYFKDLVLRVLR